MPAWWHGVHDATKAARTTRRKSDSMQGMCLHGERARVSVFMLGYGWFEYDDSDETHV